MNKYFLLLFFIVFSFGCNSTRNSSGPVDNFNEEFVVTNITKDFYFMDSQNRNSFFELIDNVGGEVTVFEREKLDEWFGPNMLLEEKFKILKKSKKQYESSF